MHRVTAFVLPAVSLLLWSSSALAQGGTSQGASAPVNPCAQHAAVRRPGCESTQSTVQYVVCITNGIPTPGGPTTYYISGIFLVDYAPYMVANVPQPPPGKSVFPWMNEFQEYVARTNPRAGKISLNCNRALTETEAKATFAAVMPSGPPNRVHVVQTGWQYAPSPPIAPPAAASATAAAAAAAAPAPAAPAVVAPAAPRAVAPAQAAATAPSNPASSATPQPRPATPKPPPEKPEKKPQYVACWAEVPSHHTAYFSATFEAHAIAEQRTEFRKMVMTTYGAVGQFNCAAKPSPAEAEQQLVQWKATARAKDTIVDTGWKP